MPSLREAARENDFVKLVGLPIAFVVVFALLSGDVVSTFVRAGVLIVFAVTVTGVRTLVDAFEYPDALKTVGLGVAFLSVSAYWFFGSVAHGPDLLVAALTALGAVYVLIGALQYRAGSEDESGVEPVGDESGDEEPLTARVRRTVADAVRDERRTTRELAADLDLTQARVEGALTLLEQQGRVYRQGGVYHPNDATRSGESSDELETSVTNSVE